MSLIGAVQTLAPRSLRLCGLMLLGLIVSANVPGFIGGIGLSPCKTSGLEWAVSLLGHALAFGGLGHWLWSSIWIVITALAVEARMSTPQLLVLWAGSVLCAGLAQLLVMDSCGPFIGPVALASAHLGCALVLIPATWGRAPLALKIYFYLGLLLVVNLLFEHWTDVLHQLVAMAFGMLVAVALLRRPALPSLAGRLSELL